MIKEKISEIFNKNKNMQLLYIILITGVVIILFANSALSKSTSKSTAKTSYKNESFITDESDNLQRELAQILSQIRGAGKVSVMLTYDETGEKHYAADVTSENSRSTDGESNARAQIQSKQTSKLVTPSNEPILTKQSYPKVRGVIVVCDGGADIQVKADITNALKAVLDVDDHKISVFARN